MHLLWPITSKFITCSVTMDGGKPLIVDPSVQQFEYVTTSGPFGNIASTSNVQSKGVISSGVVHPRQQNVIVVSSLEDIKRLQSASYNTTSTKTPIASKSEPCLNSVSNSVAVETANTSVTLHQQTAIGEPTADNNVGVTEETHEEEVPEVDISVNNVVSSFGVRCHLNLRRVALEGANVVYKRENNVSNSDGKLCGLLTLLIISAVYHQGWTLIINYQYLKICVLLK